MTHVRPGRTAKTARQIAAKKRLETPSQKLLIEIFTDPDKTEEDNDS